MQHELKKETMIKIALILFIFSPIVFWSSIQSWGFLFSSPVQIFVALGQISGLIGTMLLSITILLSTQTRWVDRFFRGLNFSFSLHAWFGTLGFIGLLLHPIFLAIGYYLRSHASIIPLFISGQNPKITFGSIGLFVIVCLVFFTLFAKPRYRYWKKSHQFLGIGLLLGAIHGFLISTSYAKSPALKFEMVVIILFALAVYIWNTILKALTLKRCLYTIQKIEKLHENVLSIYLSPIEKPIEAHPGQYIFIRFHLTSGWSQWHPFSLSHIQGNMLRISLKNLGDETKRFIKELQPSIKAEVRGAFGVFGDDVSLHAEQIWIAGGIGITPFLSLLDAVSEKQRVDFYYAVNTKSDAVFLDELQIRTQSKPTVHIMPWYADTMGYLSFDALTKTSNMETAHIYVCGPPMMMDSLLTQFRSHKIPSSHIHSERFEL